MKPYRARLITCTKAMMDAHLCVWLVVAAAIGKALIEDMNSRLYCLISNLRIQIDGYCFYVCFCGGVSGLGVWVCGVYKKFTQPFLIPRLDNSMSIRIKHTLSDLHIYHPCHRIFIDPHQHATARGCCARGGKRAHGVGLGPRNSILTKQQSFSQKHMSTSG